MDFQKLIRERYRVRAYKPDPVDDEKPARVLEAARLAPTAANRQPFRVVVIPTKGRESELRRVYNRDWLTHHTCLQPARDLQPGSAVLRADILEPAGAHR